MKTCAFAVPTAGLFAPAQATDKLPRIGYFMVRGPEATLDAVFMRGLRDLGYEEGKNILIERRYTYNKHGAIADNGRRPAGATADPLRDGDQSENRQDAGYRHPSFYSPPH